MRCRCRAARCSDCSAGFTLIELLVVIIIIGILASIAIPVFVNQRRKGWDASAKSDMRSAITAMITHHGDKGEHSIDAAEMRAIQPTVTWRSSHGVTTDDPPINTVDFERAAPGVPDGAVMTIRSKSDKCFYARIISGTTTVGPPGVTYLSAPGPCADPWNYTSIIVNSQY